MTGTKRTPAGLRRAGRALWRSVTADFEMAEHEAAQLAEACFARDRIEQLREQVNRDGLMIGSSQGVKLHPGVAEIRAQHSRSRGSWRRSAFHRSPMTNFRRREACEASTDCEACREAPGARC